MKFTNQDIVLTAQEANKIAQENAHVDTLAHCHFREIMKSIKYYAGYGNHSCRFDRSKTYPLDQEALQAVTDLGFTIKMFPNPIPFGNLTEVVEISW